MAVNWIFVGKLVVSAYGLYSDFERSGEELREKEAELAFRRDIVSRLNNIVQEVQRAQAAIIQEITDAVQGEFENTTLAELEGRIRGFQRNFSEYEVCDRTQTPDKFERGWDKLEHIIEESAYTLGLIEAMLNRTDLDLCYGANLFGLYAMLLPLTWHSQNQRGCGCA